MSKDNNYIWIFGENHGASAENNSYYFWKQVVNKEDGIDKYIVFEKNPNMESIYNTFSEHEKKFVLWKNSKKHWKVYSNADMFFVTQSYKDITPNKYLFKEMAIKIEKPMIYLRHGTAGMKVTNYKGSSFWNNLFRFLAYNPEEPEFLTTINNFKSYQPLYCEFHPRYGEFVRRDEKVADKNQILWFITWREYLELPAERRIFISYIKNVLKSKKLKKYLKNNNLKLNLCVHQLFDEETFEDMYKQSKEGVIEIVHSKDVDVMDELVKSKMLITDYSSVGYDFTLLNRPVILYQPDLEMYLRERKFYCELEELDNYNIKKPEQLVDAIVNEDYGINPFFRKALPETIDYEYIKENRHIDKLYDYFAELQRNKITILGLNFYEQGDIANSTMSLVEDLLKLGYLVQVVSLYREKRRLKAPYGLNMKSVYWEEEDLETEILKYKIHNSSRNYGILKYDPKIDLFHPYCGYYIKQLMKNIKSNTVISTREITHWYLDECTSDKVKNKIYFFHSPTESHNENYSVLLEKINNINIEKSIFIDEETIAEYENDLNLKIPESRLILDLNIVENQILDPINLDSELLDENYKLKDVVLDPDETEKALFSEFKLFKLLNTSKKHRYYGLCLANIDKYCLDELKNIIDFGNYLKNNHIENITINVIGKGDYENEFLNLIAENELFGYVEYLGVNLNMIYEIKRHDFLINLSEHPHYGVRYLQGVLNYKKVFCMKNSKSEEIFKDIPNTFIESHEWLCEQINNLYKISLKDLDDYYHTVKDEISKKQNGEKLIEYINN